MRNALQSKIRPSSVLKHTVFYWKVAICLLKNASTKLGFGKAFVQLELLRSAFERVVHR